MHAARPSAIWQPMPIFLLSVCLSFFFLYNKEEWNLGGQQNKRKCMPFDVATLHPTNVRQGGRTQTELQAKKPEYTRCPASFLSVCQFICLFDTVCGSQWVTKTMA